MRHDFFGRADRHHFTALVAAFGRNLPTVLKADVIAVQGLIGAAFFLFVLVGLWFYVQLGGTVPALLEVGPQ